MVISRTPHRMSFFGGGSDYKGYYEHFEGSVLAATFNKYCYVMVRDFPQIFAYKNQFTYSKIERFNTPDEVEHPLVREALKYLGADCIQISYDSDLPARSGIGSSSAFAVGLLNSIYYSRGIQKDKLSLAREAITLERDLCAEAGGIQDQIAVAFGGLNRINFNAEGFSVLPVEIPLATTKQLNDSLLLMLTGIQRDFREFAAEQQSRISLNLPLLHEMVALVDEGEKVLKSGKLGDFGLLMDHTWRLKRSLAKSVSTLNIDECYDRALKAGATGGKLLGAGGGGFMLLFVEPDKKEHVIERMSDLLNISFTFENSGTQILYA